MGKARGWWVGLGLTLLMCINMLVSFGPPNTLLQDSDTVKILHGIQERNDPWAWFHQDWPLANHFYRPVSTLFFEYDYRTHPTSSAGFAFTNAVLCCLTTLGLFWFLRELTDNPVLTTVSTGLFYLWQVGVTSLGHIGPLPWLGWQADIIFPDTFLTITTYGVLALGIWRHRLQIGRYVPAFLVWMWLNHEVDGIEPLEFRMLGWIPGRTASSMAVFGVFSLAAFARYLRQSPRRIELASATALDTPNTRTTAAPQTKRPSIGWPLLAIACEAIAMLAYEQGVTVPALLGLVAIYFWLRKTEVQWAWGLAFGVVLLAYVAARNAYIPPGHSEYYDWQKRTNGTAIRMLQRYLFFPYAALNNMLFYITDGGLMFLVSSMPWVAAIEAGAALAALWEGRRRWLLCGFGWLASTIAYGPMAWFKDFGHYHYWPMAMRALGVVALGWVAWDLTVIAVSRPAQQAPPRLSPAPGSLLHP